MRLVLFAVLLVTSLATLQPCAAGAAPTYVDKRVTAIPVSALLAQPEAKLVDPRRQRIAQSLRVYTTPLFFFWALSQVVALFWLWGSGSAARLRDAMRRRLRNVFLMRFAFGALLVAISGLAAFPASLVRYRIDYVFGLTAQVAATWYRDGLVATAINAAVVGIVVACVFALVDRTRLWYIYAMAGLFIVTLVMAFAEPVVVAPLYNSFRPLPATAAVARPLAALAQRAGIGGAPILIAQASRRTSTAIADIAGFGLTKRIVLSEALLANATTGEVLVLAAREFGHYAHADDFRLSLFWTSLFIFCTALAVVFADRVGFRRDDDPLARLPLVFVFLGLLALLVTPVYNGYSRNLESRADAYAIALTNDGASAVRVYVRIADETLAPLCPSRASRLYFYNSPPLGTRIAKAAGHPDPCR